MSSFPEDVVSQVIKQKNLPSDLIEFLLLLLIREEEQDFPMVTIFPALTPSEYVFAYSVALFKFFEKLPVIGNPKKGLRVELWELLGLDFEAVFVNFDFLPWEVRYIELNDSRYATVNPNNQIWVDLLKFNVSIRFPHSLKKLHTYIIGATNSGKTQLIQQLISYDLETNASIIVIDSQGDLINKLKHTKLIAPKRLVIIDPVDSVDHPLALNMFDVGQERLGKLNQVDYERHMNSVVELLNFVFSSVMESGLTDKQSVVFNFCIRLMLAVPNATIFTFVDILEHGAEQYQTYIDQLPAIAQRFFNNSYHEVTGVRNEYRSTRNEVMRRLYSLLENPTISRLFQASKNRFNMAKLMDGGKVVLISTDRSLLKTQGCAFFGRYFLSLISQAMQDRLNKPENKRRKTYVYIDECGDYLKTNDSNVSDILEKGRKYNVGITLAHQQLRQLPPEIFESIKTNTAIKFAGSVSISDQAILKKEMRTEGIVSKSLFFTTFTAGSSRPFTVNVRPGILENSEQRTKEELEAIMQENRANYCVDHQIQEYGRAAPGIPVNCDKTKGVQSDDMERYNKA